jgi:pyruvate carboxylase
MSAATMLAAVEAGVDASMRRWTPSRATPRSRLPRLDRRGAGAAPIAIRPRPEVDPRDLVLLGGVRTQYAPSRATSSPASEVYLHEMPGGQFTNLKEQARSLGLETRWHEVAQAYADVNQMFGDIVKVTPSSKVVGDMALMMVSQDLTRADVETRPRTSPSRIPSSTC